MTVLPDPIWPLVVLAAISAVDGVLCLRPAGFIAECFTRVGWPQRYWWLMPPIKFAAAGGLVAGVWVPILGILTTACLFVYFLVATSLHIRVHDYTRNLFVNAAGMLTICTATPLYCFVL